MELFAPLVAFLAAVDNIESTVDALTRGAWNLSNTELFAPSHSRAAALNRAPKVSRIAARASARNARQEELTFGELHVGESGILRALSGLPAQYAIANTPLPAFVDLGSGTGRLTFGVALAGLWGKAGEELRVGGVEVVRERHALAVQARAAAAARVAGLGNGSIDAGMGTDAGSADKLGDKLGRCGERMFAALSRVARVDLRHGDLRHGGFEHATHLFSCNCLFSRSLTRALLEATRRCARLRCLMTVRELPMDILRPDMHLQLLPNLTSTRVSTAWGRDVPVFYYCRRMGDYQQ